MQAMQVCSRAPELQMMGFATACEPSAPCDSLIAPEVKYLMLASRGRPHAL